MEDMKKMKNSLDELLATLEKIRSEQFPDVPAELLKEIVEIENEYQDKPGQRQSETIKLIMKFADSISVEED